MNKCPNSAQDLQNCVNFECKIEECKAMFRDCGNCIYSMCNDLDSYLQCKEIFEGKK